MKNTLLLFCWLLSLSSFAQNKFTNVDLYKSDDYSELESFFEDSILNKYKVYFTGENHMYAHVNSELEFKILAYLNKSQGVNHFLFEQSPAVGYIMTKVVIDNDADNKRYLKDKYFKPFYDLMISIKQFNTDIIEDENKIRVHGIDVERFPAFSIFALNHIVDTVRTDGETGKIYESIKALATSEFKDGTPDEIYNGGGTKKNLLGDLIDAWVTFETIIETSQGLKEELKSDLGGNYEIFMQILDGVEKGHDWYTSERRGDLTAPIVRERFMLNQFKKVYAQHPDSKFYGQFGRCHLHGKKDAKRCYSHDMESIASRINHLTDSTLNSKVLTIPVYYRYSRSHDGKTIEALGLSSRFERQNEIYIIDMEYLGDDNPLKGFDDDLPFVIINNYPPKGKGEVYSFEYSYTNFHIGAYYGFNYFNKISNLNNELSLNDANTFSNKFEKISFVYDQIEMYDLGHHLGFSYFPKVSNGDRFTMKGYTLTYGSNYPVGNDFFMAAFGLNYSYGQMSLVEENTGVIDNLIQNNGKNITLYKNDIFTLDPNIDLRITLPVISLNARFGYAFDVSGKYWKLNGKVKDFPKMSFTSPYFQVGMSLHLKREV
jgi:hypothetical protein